MTDPLSPVQARQAKRKKDKVRSAWISFIGRIVAQVVGAIASVILGLMVLTKYHMQEQPVAPDPRPIVHKAQRPSDVLALAVMPLQDFSKGAAHAYFADGVTEALITELAQVKGLQITSRTSSMIYKAATKPLPEIARELGVDLILEGSVVQDQALVRVTAQLIDAGTDQHVWARSYDRAIRNLLPVQAEVARRIVSDVNIALGARLAKTGTQVTATPVRKTALVH